MKHIYKVFFVVLSIVAVNQLYAAETLNLSSIGHYTFKPNQAVSISNPLFCSVSATCKLTTTDTSDTLHGKMLSGSGKLNGKNVGSGLSLQVKNRDNLKISANGFAKVQIVNQGQHDVVANCSLGKKITSK